MLTVPAVVDAAAKVTHLPSGTVSTARTNASGVFLARGLRVGGPYTIEVSGSNFAPVEVTDVFIQLNETYPLNISVEAADDVATMDTVVITALS